jgi:hypothetical protein
MPILFALARLLSILAVVGLVLGAATLPVTAGGGDMASMAISSDMSDCASKSSDCDDMKSCPFMMVCMGQMAQHLSAAVSIAIPLAASLLFALPNDIEGESRAIPPIPRPPSA